MNNDTICALATPPGGALGIIRISGDHSFDILSRIFSKYISLAKPNSIIYGHIKDGTEIIDEVMVSIFRAPHSYTGEDSVEISCHGSRYVLNKVLELLIEKGCRMANPGEYTLRAFLNGKLDLSQAEAVADLIASTNAASHKMALSQLRGGFSSQLSQLREQLLKLTSLLELELDFSDHEDLEFADRTELLQLSQDIDRHITRLADSFETGQALKEGVPVAILGAPNVGKSTLLNALVEEERAIVSDIEGTTRDTIEDVMTIDGIQFRFIDTAGLRHTDDRIEQMGMERSLQAARKARIIIMMNEPGIPYPDYQPTDHQHIIFVENKLDKLSASPADKHDNPSASPSKNVIHISAKHRQGLDCLKEALVALVPHADSQDVIISSARHYEALTHAHDNLCRVTAGLMENLSGDLLAEDLRLVLSDLSEITGEGQITPQETLNNIFSRFCVGK